MSTTGHESEAINVGGLKATMQKFKTDKVDAPLSLKSDVGHTHDDRYYTETEIDAKEQAITDLIPSQASAQNQLADKAFVNSSVATSTATYRGSYNLVSDLHLTITATNAQIATALATAVTTADNNDYSFVQVPTANDKPTEIAKIVRFKNNGTGWEYEYELNNSGYTSDQWAAINSGITSGQVSKLSALPTNADLTTMLGNKVDKTTTVNGHALSGNVTVTKSNVGLGNVTNDAQVKRSEMGAASGVATLDADGHIVSEQLDAEFPDLTAGNVVGEFSENNAEFAYRPSAGAVDIESGYKVDHGGHLEAIKGNTIAWNQIVKDGNFEDSSLWERLAGATIVFSNNEAIITLTNNAYDGIIGNTETEYYKDHKYYITATIKGSTSADDVYYGISTRGSQQNIRHVVNIGTSYQKYSFIGSTNIAPSSELRQAWFALFKAGASQGFVISAKKAMTIDLTLIYGAGNEPSTPEAFEADYFKWFGKPLTYEDYDAGSLKPVKMTGIKTVGFNQWDEEWELGIWTSYGTKDDRTDSIRSKNKIRVIPSQTYYVKSNVPLILRYYHNNGTVTSTDTNTISTITIPSDVEEMSLCTYISAGITTYPGDWCINLSHSGDKDGEYEPYWESTLSVPVTSIKGKLNGEGSSVVVFPDGLKKAGSVYDEIVRRGDKTYAIKRIGSVDMGTLNWLTHPTNQSLFYNTTLTGYKRDYIRGDNEFCSNGLCSKYNYGLSTNIDYSITLYWWTSMSQTRIFVKDTSKSGMSARDFETAMSGVYLYYELAEPQEYVLDDFELPQEYDVDDYGTEEILLGTNGIAPVLDLRYGINAGDTIKNLPHSYVSVVGKQNLTVGQRERARLNIGIDYSYARRTSFSLDDLKMAVADGCLEKYGLKVGDETTINGHTYVIAGLNPMKGKATGYRVNVNHVGLIVIPHTTQAWDASGNTSTGADGRGAGYLNSDLHYYLKNTLLPLVNTDLGAANLIGHSKLLTNAVNQNGVNKYGEATGCASGWTWEADCKICALSEVQVYGAAIWSSSGYDTGEACRQLEVFQKYSHTEIFGNEYPWLRDVASASNAAFCNDRGAADRRIASYANHVAGLILFH